MLPATAHHHATARRNSPPSDRVAHLVPTKLSVKLGWIGFVVVLTASLTPVTVTAQPSTAAPTAGATGAPPAGLQAKRTGGVPNLPSDSGQIWQEYDLTPYTKELTNVDRPQQAVVDWVLRETGTDSWFTDPFGFINADRDKLRVYHNEQMQDIVQGVYERFVNGTTTPQLYGLRLIAVGNPNWRTRAHAMMRSVPAQSPGVNAYLISKENTALLLAMMRGRTDYREISSVDLVVHNGQSQTLEQIRGRNYVQDYEPAPGAWPPYRATTGEIKEGYRLHLSPLLSVDKSTVDLVLKCNIDQVERLAKVNLELPLQTGQIFNGPINVPQVASWRLHERFRWPADQVLLLSCGVVAAPEGAPNSSLLSQGGNLLGIDRLLPQNGDRADALMIIEYRGDATQRSGNTASTSNGSPLPSSPLSRGRY
ncbi:hypothetical protein Q31a_61510 [Aureliella helgolandensis]|uniref:Uncharacterized protein n=2 Tax=Aureliella helgolandensis TaxID=2527968 RepID=A0A518GGS5_9BACT|nr:hypothetical protein Q31a_61510 [Aureliella helgolandensis]